MPEKVFVTIIINDILGRSIKTLIAEEEQPGAYRATFDATAFASGIYFYKMRAGNFNEIKKLILLK